MPHVLLSQQIVYTAERLSQWPKYRGIGIRIEDDVLVTAEGHEVLTDAVIKEPQEIERLMSAPAQH